MRMVAQSLVPPKGAFFHLAYVAGKAMSNLWSLYAVVPITILIIVYQVQHKSHRGYIALTLIAAAAVAVMSYHNYLVQNDVLQARLRASRLRSVINYRQRNKEPVPATLQGIRSKYQLRVKDTQDPWGHDLRILRPSERTNGYGVASAGPDGEFETQDDVMVR